MCNRNFIFFKSNKRRDKNLTKVNALIDQGNEYFSKSLYAKAVRFYTLAIAHAKKLNEINIRAYLNRSQAFLKVDKPYAAHLDAQKVLQIDSTNVKAMFRLGKAFYAMGKFELALENYEKCLKLNATNNDAHVEISRCRERLVESNEGVYNFEKLYMESFKRETLYMDVADYTSNKIAIVDIEFKGKGVKAMEFIKKGTLLHVSKALAAVFYNKVNYSQTRYPRIVYLDENRYNTSNESENVADLIQKMRDNPMVAAKVYSLYGGDAYDREPLDDESSFTTENSNYTFLRIFLTVSWPFYN